MDWLTTSWPDIGRIVATGLLVFVALLAYVRVVGLRSFAKMSAVDFAATVAIGSAVASVIISPATSLASGVATLAVLFAIPWALNGARSRSTAVAAVVDNDPRMLMRDGEILYETLRKEGVAIGDLRAKLREANVLQLDQVRAVVLETTGDISVLHGEADVEPWLLEGVAPAP